MKVSDNIKREQRKILKHYRDTLDKRDMSINVITLTKHSKNHIDRIIFVVHQPVRIISMNNHK
jgi:hypothetical protein